MNEKHRRSCFAPSASRGRCDSPPSGTQVAGGSAGVLRAFGVDDDDAIETGATGLLVGDQDDASGA